MTFKSCKKLPRKNSSFPLAVGVLLNTETFSRVFLATPCRTRGSIDISIRTFRCSIWLPFVTKNRISIILFFFTTEKRVGVRQSDTGRTSVGATLLGLNPANMYPVYHQYPSLETGPQNTIFNTHQQIIGDQTHPQILSKVNSRATTPQVR